MSNWFVGLSHCKTGTFSQNSMALQFCICFATISQISGTFSKSFKLCKLFTLVTQLVILSKLDLALSLVMHIFFPSNDSLKTLIIVTGSKLTFAVCAITDNVPGDYALWELNILLIKLI